jgi:hypothetical protein
MKKQKALAFASAFSGASVHNGFD